ncbi:phage scaffolding protein [Cytobacillus sp. Bac17]|uniref:phage scaffolding protein n=1 Tax=Cytobacillus sp. Bac17 TaxID=2926008 RepID=UPI00211879D4|nr:phage scaffolding protein [Cytobacillus sp. Bac17]
MDLKELLGEELYKQVMEKAGDKKIAIVSDGNWIPKEKFNELNENTKELKKQLKDRDAQLAELGEKAKGHEELTAKINELTEENKKAAAEYQQKLDQQAFDFALKSALTSVKAKNPKAVEALLNKESIKLDGDKLLGLEDQLKALQKSDAYLFETGQQSNKPTFSQGQHQTTPGGEPSTLLDALNQSFQQPIIKIRR